jgi:zona occludens toxin
MPDFTPEIEGVPESAPAYRHLITVKSAPILAGCIKSANACKCYTDQATPYPVTWEQCLEHVAHLRFNPYANPAVFQTSQTMPASLNSGQNQVVKPPALQFHSPQEPIQDES